MVGSDHGVHHTAIFAIRSALVAQGRMPATVLNVSTTQFEIIQVNAYVSTDGRVTIVPKRSSSATPHVKLVTVNVGTTARVVLMVMPLCLTRGVVAESVLRAITTVQPVSGLQIRSA